MNRVTAKSTGLLRTILHPHKDRTQPNSFLGLDQDRKGLQLAFKREYLGKTENEEEQENRCKGVAGKVKPKRVDCDVYTGGRVWGPPTAARGHFLGPAHASVLLAQDSARASLTPAPGSGCQ